MMPNKAFNSKAFVMLIASGLAVFLLLAAAFSNGLVVQAVAPATPSATVECDYLLEYLRIDLPNNPVEVGKLQRFLKENESFADLQINGVFDQATLDAVNIFQTRYSTDILSPWGRDYNQPTGYVYITTKKKINEIYCQRPFPLTPEQEEEIAGARNYPLTVIANLDNEGRVIAQATTSESSPSFSNEIESLFLAGFAGQLAKTNNALLVDISLIMLLVVLAFVFIIKRKRKQRQPYFSDGSISPLPMNFSVADGLPTGIDNL